MIPDEGKRLLWMVWHEVLVEAEFLWGTQSFCQSPAEKGEGKGLAWCSLLFTVFLLGESQGRGSLVGCHLWGRTESDTTEAT